MSGEDPVVWPFILPEFEHLYIVFVVVDRVKMTSVGEFNLCAVPDLVGVELGRNYVIWVNRVDFHDTDVRDNCVETTRVDRYSQD